MAWEGNHWMQVSRKEYENIIMRMTATRSTGILKKLSKKELMQLKNMIENARYMAVDEYKKGVAELE